MFTFMFTPCLNTCFTLFEDSFHIVGGNVCSIFGDKFLPLDILWRFLPLNFSYYDILLSFFKSKICLTNLDFYNRPYAQILCLFLLFLLLLLILLLWFWLLLLRILYIVVAFKWSSEPPGGYCWVCVVECAMSFLCQIQVELGFWHFVLFCKHIWLHCRVCSVSFSVRAKSRLRDTSFETSFRHRKIIWQRCSLLNFASQNVYVQKIHLK